MIEDRAQSVVAFGGGHGLAASLGALRQLVHDLEVDDLTAVGLMTTRRNADRLACRP